jgi:hypothetical protein
MRRVGNLVNYTPLPVGDNAPSYEIGRVSKLFPTGVVDNAGRVPSVTALRGSRSKFTVYETHLSAIETNA